MLHSFESEVIGFNSSWKIEKVITNGKSQTEDFKTKDVGCSDTELVNIGIQTEEVSINKLDKVSPALLADLNSWLKGVSPMILKELSNNDASIFTGGDDDYEYKESESNVRLLQKLQRPENEEKMSFPDINIQDNSLNFSEKQESNDKFSVISVCWSQSGNSLAVGYGIPSHDDWCQHNGVIDIFIKSSRQQDLLKYFVELKLGSCSSVMAYHPTESALFAAASVSGDVCIWNMQQEYSDSILNTCSEHLASRVSSILWLQTDQADYFLLQKDKLLNQVLVTGCTDGTITIWLVNKAVSMNLLKLKQYDLNGSLSMKSQSHISPDITCMDFLIPCKNNSGVYSESFMIDTFVVGCRTGQILLCQASKSKNMTGSGNAGNGNPFVNSLEPHGACVLNLSFSTSKTRSLLLSLGADLEIRIYVVPQDYPIQIICLHYQLSSVAWIPNSDKLIIGAVGQSKRNTNISLLVFDISVGKELLSIPSIDEYDVNSDVPSIDKHSPCGITSLALNYKNPTILACGNMCGMVYIWKLPY